MSAETLRRAAALMRERAEAATPGRWIPFGNSIGAEVDGCTCHGGIEPYGHEQYCGVEGPVVQAHATDVEHIAPLGTPAVALAVADWLEDTGDRLDDDLEKYRPSNTRFDSEEAWVERNYRAPLHLARAYLGETA